ncbi:hypothetical protein EBU71_14820 [bacterium]|nr:hypothetical protein [Candidatus Elulimicrobium humile]
MNDIQIGEIWTLFKDFLSKDDISTVAEQFVDLLADFNIKDKVLQGALGVDPDLDAAIEYYLEDDSDDEEDSYPEDYDDEDEY